MKIHWNRWRKGIHIAPSFLTESAAESGHAEATARGSKAGERGGEGEDASDERGDGGRSSGRSSQPKPAGPRPPGTMSAVAPCSCLPAHDPEDLAGDILDTETKSQSKDWLYSFRDLDPRFQILNFFKDLALDGVENFEKRGSYTQVDDIPEILRGFNKSGIFSVWRPTSADAIRKMITGEGTGKGLDIKGKSAKRGAYSGFVPFLQIHHNEQKKEVGPMRPYHRVRVFYPNRVSRESAATVLDAVAGSMVDLAKSAEEIVKKEEQKRACRRSSMLFMKDMSVPLSDTYHYQMDNPNVYKIDDYAESQGVYGLDIPEKVFWEGYIVVNDITRAQGSKYDTGRPSMPEFQEMNIETLRNWSRKTYSAVGEADPRPVLWHAECGNVGEDAPKDLDPMCPLNLLMAYEEGDRVTPVVSDFDCFLLGTRGVSYHEALCPRELSMLSACVDEIEGILETQGGSWTQRWLEVKKKQYKYDNFSHEIPRFGYADPRSYKIMTGAVHRLKSNGAVRHGPECFNYGFPQDLDDQYLVVSDSFPGVPWRYANPRELIGILCEKIDEGFTFPLNPKWILCDPGWREVYKKLMASDKPNVKDSMDVWYPEDVRIRINDISSKFPYGFIDQGKDPCAANISSGVATDLAQLELRKYMVRMEAKRKLQNAFSKQNTARRLHELARAIIDEESEINKHITHTKAMDHDIDEDTKDTDVESEESKGPLREANSQMEETCQEEQKSSAGPDKNGRTFNFSLKMLRLKRTQSMRNPRKFIESSRASWLSIRNFSG